jgi:hypothetical protein
MVGDVPLDPDEWPAVPDVRGGAVCRGELPAVSPATMGCGCAGQGQGGCMSADTAPMDDPA